MFDYLTELGLPEEAVSFFLTVFIGVFAVSAVIGIAIYLLESISVYKMAKSAEVTRRQAYLSLLIDGMVIRDSPAPVKSQQL